MIVDFYKGGSGFDPYSDQEAVKKTFLSLIVKIFIEIYKRDRTRFVTENSIETWVMDDLINQRWGVFTSDYLVAFVDTLSAKKPEIREMVNNELLINGDSILKAFKAQVVEKIKVKVESLGGVGVLKGVESEEFVKMIIGERLSMITLDSLIACYSRLQVRNLEVRISLVEQLKIDYSKRIELHFMGSKMSAVQFAKKHKIHASVLSKILNRKIEGFTLDKIVSVLDQIENNNQVNTLPVKF